MKIILPIVGAVVLLLSCAPGQVDQDNLVTIVDIGKNDRIALGKQLRLINSYSPKLIALDFFLDPDSLDKDTILVKELAKFSNIVQVVALHKYDSTTDTWDSLEVSNSKFKISLRGFSNISTTEDSVFIRQLPLHQSYKNKLISSFSYVIAQTYSNVKAKYRNSGTKYISFPYLQLNEGYSAISKEDLISGNFAKSDIRDKIVIMGYIGYGDDYYLDHGRHWKINGAAIHAAIINEIIER